MRPIPKSRACELESSSRVIPSRFPANRGGGGGALLERVASLEDFDALYALEAMTNDRIRDEVGEISLVPVEERLFGNGSSPIMAAFARPVNPQGSRFSDGTYGVFYCAHDRVTAIEETSYHQALFMGATQEAPMRLQMRLYSVEAKGEVIDLRAASTENPRIVDPNDYSHPQSIGREFAERGGGRNSVSIRST